MSDRPHPFAVTDQGDLNRRDFFAHASKTVAAGSIVGAVLAGCSGENSGPGNSTAEMAPAASRSVPLLVALLANDGDAAAIRRAWSAVSEQPIEFVFTKLDRANPIDTAAFLASARRADVAIFPMALMGDASTAEAVIEYSATDLESIRTGAGTLLVALRNGTNYGAMNQGIPIGAPLPSLFSTVATEPLADWGQYDRWVDQELDGRASEPLAPGWPGAMFLWRAASSIRGTWLFSHEGLEPLITEEDYVDVLSQMKQTADRYGSDRLSPEEIWRRLAQGELIAAIGLPQTQTIDGLTIGDLPGESTDKQDPPRVLLDIYTPIVSISSGCRQSVIAKQFVAWLCGGDGSENLRNQVPTMTVTRTKPLADESGNTATRQSEYDAWLAERLGNTITLPTIQIHAASEYYLALDRQVGRCLEGEVDAADALGEVAQRWRLITKRVGIEKQERQWRRCQGIGV